jgi:hypothetical protein
MYVTVVRYNRFLLKFCLMGSKRKLRRVFGPYHG